MVEIVAETNKDWWVGRVHGREALFPSNYVEKVQTVGNPEKKDKLGQYKNTVKADSTRGRCCWTDTHADGSFCCGGPWVRCRCCDWRWTGAGDILRLYILVVDKMSRVLPTLVLVLVLVVHHAPPGCAADQPGSRSATAIQENARPRGKSLSFYVIVGCLHGPVWHAGPPPLRAAVMGRMACGRCPRLSLDSV